MNILNLVINSVNVAGIPANHLKELNVPGKEFTESFKAILSERKSKFEVLNYFGDTDTLQLRLIN